MKKLVVGCFAFVFALALSTSVFAQNYDITEFCGENGLINRGYEQEPFITGDVLNVKNDITQEPNEQGYVESNWVLGGYYDDKRSITINGNGHTFDGNGYDGFHMQGYNSGSMGREATINNATLTNFGGEREGYSFQIYGAYEEGEVVKLTLNDVNIVDNTNARIDVWENAMLDINSSNSVKISSNVLFTNEGIVNFKGNNIRISDTPIENYSDGEMYNYSNLTIDSSIRIDGLFENRKTVNLNGEPSSSGQIDNYGTINIGGDSSGFNGGLYVENGTINLLKKASYFGERTHNFYKNGTLNLANDYIDDSVVLGDLEISGIMKLNIDVDLAEQAIDDVTFGDVYPEFQDNQEVDAKISLNKINLLSDANSKYTTYTFGENAEEYIELASSQKEILGPIFAYKVSYGEEEKGSSDEGGDDEGGDNLPFDPLQPGDEGGDNNLPFNPLNPAQDPTTGADAGSDEAAKTALLQFERLGGGDGEVDLTTGEKIEGPVNPVLLQSKVAIAASSISQEEVFDTILNNAGNYTYFQKQGSNAGDVEDRAAPTLWIKAFGSQEDVDMEDYTKVKTTYYGAVVGLDWDRQYSDNFDATYGIFASYIGGELKDEDWSEGDFKVKQNGGYAGLRGNWYIGKLFINGIVDYGMLQNDADNPYKSNDFNSQVIGLAARVGYNFEVARRRFTIQPSVGATGKYIITDDFETELKNGKDIKEEMDDVTNITVEPGLKLALNLGKCWILSGEGKYVIENFSGDTKVKGEDLDFILPDTSYKNYTNVGLGIEKIWGYTVLHVKGNKTFGGRDGYMVNAGIEFK